VRHIATKPVCRLGVSTIGIVLPGWDLDGADLLCAENVAHLVCLAGDDLRGDARLTSRTRWDSIAPPPTGI